MKEIAFISLFVAATFLIFLLILIAGIVKKSQTLKRASVLVFLFFVVGIGGIGYTIASKSYHKITDAFTMRTGYEIYDALFGKRQTDCVKIIHFQDQVIPKIDYAIWLQFTTCPDELKRILSQNHFKAEIQSTHGWNTAGPLDHQNWFKPETLGDSILLFTFQKDEFGNGQYIYSSMDSTHVFVQDIQD